MSHARDGNIVLIGMRGAGKTTLGRELADRLGRPFVDTDDELARAEGADVDALLVRAGEAAFRRAEARVLRALAGRRGLVVATGGGAVLHGEPFAALCRDAHVIYLAASPGELQRRAARRPRPPLTALPPADECARLLAERDPLYRAAARSIVSVEDRDPILALLAAVGGNQA